MRLLYEEKPEGEGPVRVCCDLPGHADSTPSACIYPDHYFCYGCKGYEGWLDHCKRKGVYADALRSPAPLAALVVHSSREAGGGCHGGGPAFTPEELYGLSSHYAATLWDCRKDTWLADRGISLMTAQDYLIGHTGRAYSIPIWSGPPNDGGEVQTIRFRKDDALDPSGAHKYWGLKGLNKAYLFAPNGLGPKVVICEGELDCLLVCQFGYQAVTITNGIGSFDFSPWAERFQEVEEVVVAVDRDTAGVSGRAQIGKSVSFVPRIKYPRWWEKDLTDLWKAQGEAGIHSALGGVDAPAGNPH